MSIRTPRVKSILYAIGFGIVLLLISGSVFITFLKDPGMNGYVRAQFDEMVNGTAYKPFVTRALVPGAVRLIADSLPKKLRELIDLHVVEYVNAVPQDIRDAIDETDNPGTNKHSNFTTLWEDITAEYLIACILLYPFLLGFFFAIRYLFRSFFSGPRWFIDALGLGAIAALPPFFVYYNYIYDFPTLFFTTLLLALMARRKWVPFLVVFLFSCWNKETTILLTMVFGLAFWGRWAEVNRKSYGLLLIAQMLIYAAVRIPLTLAFWNNPGSTFEFHFIDHNLSEIFLQLYSFADVFVVLGALLLLAYRWKEKPRFLKIALTMVIPLLLLATIFGYLDEFRAFYELFPVATCLAGYTIGKILEVPLVSLSADPALTPAKTGLAII
jgi:hypothetical protein